MPGTAALRASVIVAACCAACSHNPAPASSPASPARTVPPVAAGVSVQPFGTADGQAVSLYTFRNANGMVVRATNDGGIIVSLLAPDRAGKFDDIVLGYDSAQQYVPSTTYFGAIIGRYGNRIGHAQFTVDGQTYHLSANDHGNTLHGGVKGWDKVVWQAEPFENDSARGVVFRYTSPDGEMGFPGTVHATVTYTLTNRNELVFEYAATTDKATPINLTHHDYWNLRGAGKGNVLGHLVTIFGDSITPVDSLLIPTGAMTPVAGTPFDFRTPHPIGERINANDTQIRYGPGYDHNWALNGSGPRHAAHVVEPTTGRVMDVYTMEPGLQFYSGNFLNGVHGKNGTVYNIHDGFCMETQHYPDSPNKPQFPSTIVRPGQEYQTRTMYIFSTQR